MNISPASQEDHANSDGYNGALRSQFVILKPGRGRHRKFLPYAFTEHGAIWQQLQPLLQPPPEPPKRRIGFLPDES